MQARRELGQNRLCRLPGLSPGQARLPGDAVHFGRGNSTFNIYYFHGYS